MNTSVQYAFYLRYVLGLQEDETIRQTPAAREFLLHRIFESLKDSSTKLLIGV